MASSLETNKILAAILTGGIIASGSGVVSRILYHPTVPEEPAYVIEVATGGDEAVEAVEEELDIGTLLASADTAAGEKTAKKCTTCHSFEEGGANKVGPNLYGIVGREIGAGAGFSYSGAMAEFGGTWDDQALDQFLANPKGYMPGTKMAFAGIKAGQDRADLIMYLRSYSPDAPPMPEAKAATEEASSGESDVAAMAEAAVDQAEETVDSAVDAASDAAAEVADQTEEVAEAASDVVDSAQEGAAAAADTVQEAAGDAVADATETAEETVEGAAEQVESAVQQAGDAAAGAAEAVTEVAEAAASNIEEVTSSIVDAAGTTVAAVTETVGKASEAVGGDAPGTALMAAVGAADVAKGEKIAKKCKACHVFDEGGKNKLGPALWDIVGRDIASHDGYKYSKALAALEGEWTFDNLDQFLAAPKTFLPGTKMVFAGVKKEQDRANLLAYLRSLSNDPVPLTEGG